jgi:nucleotide-binding universal stress UspA family protein
MKKILVPIDFSDSGKNAAEYAAKLASELGYSLLLLHVYNMPLSLPGEVPGAMMIDFSQLEKDVKAQVDEEAKTLAGLYGISVSSRVMAGFITDEIVETEKSDQPSLIIMGITSSGPVNEFVFGSVATDILNKIKTPLLIVPEDTRYKKMEKVVFAVGDNNSSEMELPSVYLDLLKHFGSSIYVLNVVKESEMPESDKGIISKQLEAYFKNTFHSYSFIENEDVVEGLNDFIELHNIDLVTMIPHKHNLFQIMFREGTTRKMAFHSHVPLFSISGQNQS